MTRLSYLSNLSNQIIRFSPLSLSFLRIKCVLHSYDIHFSPIDSFAIYSYGKIGVFIHPPAAQLYIFNGSVVRLSF